MLRIRRMSRCRAIVCSQYEQAIEPAPASSIAPSGTACRNAQLQVYRNKLIMNPWDEISLYACEKHMSIESVKAATGAE